MEILKLISILHKRDDTYCVGQFTVQVWCIYQLVGLILCQSIKCIPTQLEISALPSHLIFSTGPGPGSSGTGDLGLQGEQGVKQRPGLSDLACNVGIRVLAKRLSVL